jgi:outer membrane protein assembly factor BamB
MRRTRGTIVALFAAATVMTAAVPEANAARSRSTWKPNSATRWEVGGGGDDFRTGFAPAETAPPFISCGSSFCRGTGDADGPWLEWVTKISDLPTGAWPEAGIVVVDGILYLAGGATNSFLALDVSTGLPIWRFTPDPRTDGNTGQYPSSNAPVVKNGIVYATFSNGYVYALNAKTGRKIWSYRATEGYRDEADERAGDADHPVRAALGSYTEESQLDQRSKFGPVHPGVDYPKIHGATAYCEGKVFFMTLAGWVYGLDAGSGRLLWKRYADAPEFPGELVWPEYLKGGALRPSNSSAGSTTRRFEAVPGVGCLNGEVQVAGSDGHVRFLDPATGKQGDFNCGYSNQSCTSGGGRSGPEYDRLAQSVTGPVDACAASGFNCDIAVGLAIPPLEASQGGSDYIVTTLDSRIIRLTWDEHKPVWRREYSAPLPFETAGADGTRSLPLSLDHLEDGFIAQAVVGAPMALDPDIAGKGARPILYAAAQDGHVYVISVNELGGGLRTGDSGAPALLARFGVSENQETRTPYTRGDVGGPWDFNENALSGMVLGGGVLYVPTWDNRMTAFDVRDPADPKKIWDYEVKWDPAFRYPPFGDRYPDPFIDIDLKIFSSAALLGGHLYFAANDGSIYAFNLRRQVKTVRNLVVLGSGLVPFIPKWKEPLGAFDRVWTPADFYKNQIGPPGYRLPRAAGVAGAGGLLLANAVLLWWYRRRQDVTIEIREGAG